MNTELSCARQTVDLAGAQSRSDPIFDGFGNDLEIGGSQLGVEFPARPQQIDHVAGERGLRNNPQRWGVRDEIWPRVRNRDGARARALNPGSSANPARATKPRQKDPPESQAHCVRLRRMIHALTGLRFVAALWVVLFHLRLRVPDYDMGWGRRLNWGPIDGIFWWGHHGVEVFFILSGFVMSLSHRQDFSLRIERGSYFRYILMRFGRVFPLHLTLLLYLVVMVSADVIERRSPMNDGLALQLTLTQSWVPSSMFSDLTWNMPAWSVSAEWAAYLIFPFLARAMAMIHWTPNRVTLAALALLVPYYATFEGKNLPWHLGEMAMLRIATGFGIGMLTYEVYRQGWTKNLSWNYVPGFLIYLAVAYAWTPQLSKVTIVVLAALFILALASSNGAVTKVLGHRIMVYLGGISYGVYLVHYPLFLTISRTAEPLCQWLGTSAHRWQLNIAAAILIAVLLLLSSLLYHVVEKPARHFFRRLALAIRVG
jgi:peptidoglycan/LPS O-acetylase OafA/YrhL